MEEKRRIETDRGEMTLVFDILFVLDWARDRGFFHGVDAKVFSNGHRISAAAELCLSFMT